MSKDEAHKMALAAIESAYDKLIPMKPEKIADELLTRFTKEIIEAYENEQ